MLLIKYALGLNPQMTIYSGTWDCSAFFELAEGKSMAMPGEDVSAVLRLVKPMVLEEGQQITIRNSGETIGSGKVSSKSYFCKSVFLIILVTHFIQKAQLTSSITLLKRGNNNGKKNIITEGLQCKRLILCI